MTNSALGLLKNQALPNARRVAKPAATEKEMPFFSFLVPFLRFFFLRTLLLFGIVVVKSHSLL
jgi:hypothetical protein